LTAATAGTGVVPLGALHRLRLDSIGLSRVFEGLRPLVARSRQISFNARIAVGRVGDDGESFSVVARELTALGDTLIELVGEAEVATGELIRRAARLALAERRLRSLATAVWVTESQAGLADRSGITPTDVVDRALRPGQGDQWRAIRARLGTGNAVGDARPALVEAIITTRSELVADLDRMSATATALDRAVTKVERTAVLQGFFVAANGRIEAERIGAGARFATLAEEIAATAQETGQLVGVAQQRIAALHRAVGAVARPLRAEAASTTTDRRGAA
jgi:hypothetical protein